MKKVLFVGQLPPPMHGQAQVNKIVMEADFKGVESICLPMRYSRSMDQVGSAGIGKVLQLVILIIKTWGIWLIQRPTTLYYPPASSNKVPVIRDIVYLGATRFLFRQTIFHFHAGGLGQYLDSIGFIGRLAQWVYRRPDVAIELYEEKDSPGRYFSAKRIEVVPNGLDAPYDSKKQKARREGEVFTILFVASLREDKGVLDVLRTVAELKKRRLIVNAVLAGAWSSEVFKSEALALAKELGVESQVSWAGVVSGEEKWNLFREADCFLFPSFFQSEKFPLVLIEALGMSLPIISTNWRGIPQLLSGSESVIKEPGDVEGFADELAEWMIDSSKLASVSEVALKHHKSHYTLEKFIERMEGIFDTEKLT